MQRAGSRVVGFDCAEEEHVAVLLDEEGEVEQRFKVVNRRDRIQECLARLILTLGNRASSTKWRGALVLRFVTICFWEERVTGTGRSETVTGGRNVRPPLVGLGVPPFHGEISH